VGTLVVVLVAGNLWQWTAAHPHLAGDRYLVTSLTSRAPGASGTVFFDPQSREGVLVVRDLAADQNYRLWVVHGKEWKSVGTFTADQKGAGSLVMTVPSGAVEAFCVSRDEGEVYRSSSWVLLGSL
jgi:hypothetical protein